MSTLPIVGPDFGTPEWHDLRRFNAHRIYCPVVFGATDAAACCGISPYRTPLDVFVEKRMGAEVEENDAMRMGKRLEPIILDEYEHRRKVKLRRKLPMFLHGSKELRWMGATPDGIVVTESFGDELDLAGWVHGVDAKASTFRRLDKDGEDPLKFGVEGTDQMPVDYVCQGQQQCAVLGLPYVEFPVLFDARTLRIYRVDRDDNLISMIAKAEQEMFERLMNNDPPEPTWEHDNTRELIGALFGHRAGESRQLDEQDRDHWSEVCCWKDQIKELEGKVRAEQNRLLFKLEGAECGILPAGQKQLKRIVIRDTLVTEKDVADLREKVGQIKRRGYSYLRETAVKEK